MKSFFKSIWLPALAGMLLCQPAPCLALNWHTDLTAAITAAQASGKNIVMMAGRETCGNCSYMKQTVFESENPPVRELVSTYFEPVFLDVDASDEWRTYVSDTGSFTLPLICVIELSRPDVYVDRTFGKISIYEYYDHLSAVVDSLVSAQTFPEAPAISVVVDGTLVKASWTGVEGASGYVFYFAPYPAGAPIYSLDMGAALEISAGLPAGSAFYVAVKACNSAGQSDFSNITFFSIQP